MSPLAPALGPARKKARLVKAWVVGRPIWCTWQLTPRCGSLCVFCEHRSEGAGIELDEEGCRRVAQTLAGMGTLVVSLSGGDPFLRPDLPGLVGLLARSHFPLVTTHGWLVTRDKARALWRAGLEGASVTLDHAEAAVQDRAAGVPGAHARAVAALEALAGERTRGSQQVNVKARLHPEDLSGLPALLRLAAAHSATVSVEPGFPLPAEAPGRASVAARLRELKTRHPNLRTSRFYLDRLDQALSRGVPGCQAGRAFFNVDHRGHVTKCLEFRRPEDRVGDAGREPAAAVLPRLAAVPRANRCQACWYASRGEVEGLSTVRGFLGGLAEMLRA